MIGTPLSWQLSEGCLFSLILGGIPVMELQQKEGNTSLILAEWKINLLDTYRIKSLLGLD